MVSLSVGVVVSLAMLVSSLGLRALWRAEEQEADEAPDSLFWRPRF
jgi:hypothetical protein